MPDSFGFTFTITSAMISGAVVAFVWWLIKYVVLQKLNELRERRELLQSHIKLCHEKEIAFLMMEKRVQDIEKQVEADRRVRHWIGDCIMAIAGQVGAKDLPERPQ